MHLKKGGLSWLWWFVFAVLTAWGDHGSRPAWAKMFSRSHLNGKKPGHGGMWLSFPSYSGVGGAEIWRIIVPGQPWQKFTRFYLNGKKMGVVVCSVIPATLGNIK
jgi:hypothetical protein